MTVSSPLNPNLTIGSYRYFENPPYSTYSPKPITSVNRKWYSSLTRLEEIPVDDLKIDKEFVLVELVNQSNVRIIEAFARMASALDIRVTTEGVESREYFDLISELSCACAQGFYFDRPTSPASHTRSRCSLERREAKVVPNMSARGDF